MDDGGDEYGGVRDSGDDGDDCDHDEQDLQQWGQEEGSPRFLCCRSFDYSMGLLERPPRQVVALKALRRGCAVCVIGAALLLVGAF